MEPEKLDLRSHDIADDKRQELLRFFPEIRTEGGRVDIERLKLALGETVDVGKERYGMNWPGKADCFKTIQMPSLATLRPCPEESVNFATTENLIIEGDNLEVLKLLQKSYLGKVKMIYIDPPYNTGSDFIYPDNYSESLQTYLEYTGQVDAEGKKFSTNAETDGRFHSKWLNMRYSRLYLARNLLREDGAIFVSCDDTEVSNLHRLLDEIFGEENSLAQIVWKKSYGGGSKTKHVVVLHEYALCYARSKDSLGRIELPPDPKARRYYKFQDSKFEKRGPYRLQPLATTSNDERENLRYAIPYKGEEIWPEKQWQWEKARTFAALENDELVITKQKDEWSVNYKQYLYDEDGIERGAKPYSVLEGPYTQAGTSELASIFGDQKLFPFPKPSGLIQHFVQYASPDKDFIVLDFFAGSGSTAHAVLSQNSADNGNRKFILVQLPEPTEHKGYPTIADITKERVRRVIKKLNEEDSCKLDLEGAKPRDRGFKVFKLAESNFKPWNVDVPHDAPTLEKQLDLHVDHIRDNRTSDDLPYEILLKSGFALTTPARTLTLAGKTVHSVADGALFICLEGALTLELIRAMAEKKPERVVCLDEGFAGNDQLKTNAVQIFKTKGVTSFKTV
ncbi:MAG: site-specific DNA-methyltransferase [Nitrospirae bacterium]|nr:site-specific DNA-methyltransferase [Nitrospirota bacterium]